MRVCGQIKLHSEELFKMEDLSHQLQSQLEEEQQVILLPVFSLRTK